MNLLYFFLLLLKKGYFLASVPEMNRQDSVQQVKQQREDEQRQRIIT